MENLFIKESRDTPEIKMNFDEGIISFIGKSYPSNTFEFYRPVTDWLDKYFQDYPRHVTVINVDIIYFNSSSSKLFFDLFDIVEEAHEKGQKITVNWFCNSDDMYTVETAEEFKDDFEELNFNIIIKNEEGEEDENN